MREGLAILAFTDRGEKLAARLAAVLDGEWTRTGRGLSLTEWTANAFLWKEALIFVGAAGIAVRAVAPFVDSKAEDPAVICVDEQGRYAIPLLSGHLGGANELARKVAAETGGEAVITTATDLAGVFAVDLWARMQGMAVLQPERIKAVSLKVLREEEITVCCPFPVTGKAPEHVRLSAGEAGDVLVSYRTAVQENRALQLVPKCLVLGIGCRRGASCETIEEEFRTFCRERGILPQAVLAAATVDLKRNERGLQAFCREHAWPLRYYSADQLREAEGCFTGSAFVKEKTGVDNVCERAAVLSAGGRIAESKYAASGVTFALAEKAIEFDWRC